MPDAPAPDAHLYIHYCLHPGCGKWGGYGFDRVEQRQKKTDWWCWEHYPYKEPFALRRREPVEAP